MIEFKTLEQIDNKSILECFNLAFSDYYVPLKLNVQQLNNKIHSENIDKEISVGAFRNGKLIGLILHGKRNTNHYNIAYNAGTGVIPGERGNALTLKMYEYIYPVLKSNNVTEIHLEVISQNIPAIKSYSKYGFKKVRSLNCFKGNIEIKNYNPDVSIKVEQAIEQVTIQNLQEVKPSWQNSLETIKNLKDAVYIRADYKAELAAYCILNRSNNRIIQIAVDQKYRNQLIASTILKYIKDHYNAASSIINVDSSYENLTHFFENRNMKFFLQQDEMKLKLTKE